MSKDVYHTDTRLPVYRCKLFLPVYGEFDNVVERGASLLLSRGRGPEVLKISLLLVWVVSVEPKI